MKEQTLRLLENELRQAAARRVRTRLVDPTVFDYFEKWSNATTTGPIMPASAAQQVRNRSTGFLLSACSRTSHINHLVHPFFAVVALIVLIQQSDHRQPLRLHQFCRLVTQCDSSWLSERQLTAASHTERLSRISVTRQRRLRVRPA